MDSFTLKVDVKFENNIDIKQFISQFQVYCTQLICIINDTVLKIYTKNEQLPKNITYLYMKKNKIREYYFKDLDTNDIYCIFGKAAAKVFYPNLLDLIDDEGKYKPSKPILVTYSNIEPKSIVLYHREKRIDIPWINKEVDIFEIEVFK